MTHAHRFSAALAATLLVAATAGALSSAERCEAGKVQTTGKYAFCRMKADAKAVKTGSAADYSKCDDLLHSKWDSLETKALGACPSNGDELAIRGQVASCADRLGLALSGASGGRFVDNGDGTISDTQTGLTWEKKVALNNSLVTCTSAASCPNPHDADNTYAWSIGGTAFDGPAATVFLAQLNDVAGGGANCFAQHCDWRLPAREELESIFDLAATSPAVDAAFRGASCGAACTDLTNAACSCTASLAHWSSDTVAATSNQKAWGGDFGFAFWGSITKTTALPVRAVRGGA